MINHDTEIVLALQAALAARVGQGRYDLWFAANARLAHSAGSLTIYARNKFYLVWLRTNFRKELEAACQETLGATLPIVFEIDTSIGRAEESSATVDSPKPANVADAASATSAAQPPTIETTAQSFIDSASSNPPIALSMSASTSKPSAENAAAAKSGQPTSLSQALGRRPFAKLESFIAGAGNRVAAACAAEVAEFPGRVSPLVIHGPPGVGKTHLLEGIWTAAKRRNPRLHAVYLTAEQFTSYFLEALHSSGLPNFRHKHRNVDLLLIDDLQFFAGKKVTLVELLHTIDTLQRAGKQIVFAADRAPANLAGLGPELESRLSAGLVCRVEAPDHATRETIVRQYATSLGLSLMDDVATHLASAFRGGVRELIGAVHQLHATSRALGRPATMNLVHEALSESPGSSPRAVKLADVQQAVCEVFGLDPQSLQAEGRASAVSHPRMLAMWLSRKHTRAGLSEIGQFFGKRSHTTVISANKKVAQWINACKTLPLAGNATMRMEDAIRRVEQRLLA